MEYNKGIVAQAAFLFNPSSGRGKSLKKRRNIESVLKKEKIRYKWLTSKSEKHLKKLAKSASKEYPVIVAVGGDTTFQIVASELLSAKTDAAMGMLGTGSTNDITRCLGIQRPKQLCRAIKSGQTRQMDVGYLEIPGEKHPTLFLGTLSLGMGVEVNQYMAKFWARHPLLKRGGDWVQTAAGIGGIRDTFRRGAVPSKIRIRAEGLDEWFDFALLAFTNINYYAGGLRLIPETNPFDGQLGCCVIQTEDWRQTIAVARLSQKGKHVDHPRVKIYSGSSFQMESEEPVTLQYDGEVTRPTREFRIFLQPAALKIVG